MLSILLPKPTVSRTYKPASCDRKVCWPMLMEQVKMCKPSSVLYKYCKVSVGFFSGGSLSRSLGALGRSSLGRSDGTLADWLICNFGVLGNSFREFFLGF